MARPRASSGQHDLLLVAARQRARGRVDRRACGPAGAPPARARGRAGGARRANHGAVGGERDGADLADVVHTGLSSMRPKRRWSPGTNATPAVIAARGPTGRPPRSSTRPASARGGPRRARGRSVPAAATPARPTISPGVARSPIHSSRPATDTSSRRTPDWPSAAPAGSARAAPTAASAPAAAGTAARSPSIASTTALVVSPPRHAGERGAAVAQHRDLVAHREDLLEDVRDEHDRDAAPRRTPSTRSSASVSARSSAEVGSSRTASTRGPVTSARATLDESALGERQSADRRAQGHVEAEVGDDGGARAAISPRRTNGPPRARASAQVGQDVEVLEQAELLGDDRDAVAGGVRGARERHRAAVEAHRPGVGAHRRDDLHERRLPAPFSPTRAWTVTGRTRRPAPFERRRRRRPS